MNNQPTPTPWHHSKNFQSTGCVAVRDHDGDAIAYTTCERQEYGHKQNDLEAKANAAFIVLAVNSHEQLVAALELILPLAKGYVATHQVGSNADYIETARAALAAAKQKN